MKSYTGALDEVRERRISPFASWTVEQMQVFRATRRSANGPDNNSTIRGVGGRGFCSHRNIVTLRLQLEVDQIYGGRISHTFVLWTRWCISIYLSWVIIRQPSYHQFPRVCDYPEAIYGRGGPATYLFSPNT